MYGFEPGHSPDPKSLRLLVQVMPAVDDGEQKRRNTMDIATVRAFFMWCTILNGGLLILSLLIFACAGDWVYRMHSKWFPIPRDAFNIVIYSFMGLFKIFFLIFNLVPYVALVIVG